MLTEAQAQLFRGRNPAVVGTINADGTPQLSVVWVDLEGDEILFNTTTDRLKAKNLKRDSRMSVLVVDDEDLYRWVAVSGRATLSGEGPDGSIDRLARKYRGTGWQPRPGEQRVRVLVSPERVVAYGLDE